MLTMDEATRARFLHAHQLAFEWHADQTRKGNDIPYVSHLMQVAGAVLEFSGDVDQAIAGLLHDALEDAPTAPERAIEVLEADDRPQPIRDVNRGDGMTVTVGRVRDCSVLGLKMTVLSHNTIRGAAGAAVLNVETLLARTGHAPT